MSKYAKGVAAAIYSTAIILIGHFTGIASDLSFVASALGPVLITAGVIVAPANTK